jgi:AraC-like DNA-binding protein
MSNPASPAVSDFNADLKKKGFKVYQIDTSHSIVRNFDRRHFYKICLVSGKSIVNYADKGIEIEGSVLFFGNPHIPYSWEIISEKQKGYTCLFSEDFLKRGERSESLQESPLFKIGGATPVFHLGDEQWDFLATIFQKMIAEQATDYVFMQDLIRNYINLIIHEALKLQPAQNFYKHKNASSRIASLFLELLERQFPIERADQRLELKSAQDYARRLSVHVNHLNRSVKEITGRPTTAHISERLLTEARSLLQHTDWSISDIAYALGFDYPTYFHSFFKRKTGAAPTSLRG